MISAKSGPQKLPERSFKGVWYEAIKIRGGVENFEERVDRQFDLNIQNKFRAEVRVMIGWWRYI